MLELEWNNGCQDVEYRVAVLECELGWKRMVGQTEVLKCGTGRERQAASNDKIDWERVPRETSLVGNKASVRARRSGVGGLGGQGANSVAYV